MSAPRPGLVSAAICDYITPMKLRPHPSCARSLVVLLESDIQGINTVYDNSVWDELTLIIPYSILSHLEPTQQI